LGMKGEGGRERERSFRLNKHNEQTLHLGGHPFLYF
jgi:hypothetical protein